MTMTLIVHVESNMNVACGPFESSLTVLLVFLVLAFIDVVLSYLNWLFIFRLKDFLDWLLPNSLAFLQAIFEATFISVAIRPRVFSLAFWMTILVVSHVYLAVRKFLRAFTVFEAQFPLAFIPVAV
jgi:hypothetical protein